MKELAKLPCVARSGTAVRLDDKSCHELLVRLPAWSIDDNGHLTREYRFADFARGLAFVNELGQMADEVEHHPDVLLRYGSVRLEVWTHTIDGLAIGDFAFAARAELLYAVRAER